MSSSPDALILETFIEVKADPSAVWDALVNPEITQQYMFGCIPVTDWKVGNELIWRGAKDGVDYVKGRIIKFEPETCLAFSTYDPNSHYQDDPKDHVVGEFRISESGGGSKLEISQGDFSKVENGQQRYEETVGAWKMTLGILKGILDS